MVKTLLPEPEFEAFKDAYTKPIKKSIKILNNYGRAATIQHLTCDGRIFTPPSFSRKWKIYDDVLFVDKADKTSLWSHILHSDWKFYVQEMSAGMPAQIIDPKPWEIVLDMCGAPWGKSIQLSDFVWKEGLVISNEPSPARRKALSSNLERCGAVNTIVTGYDGRQFWEILPETFDKILLDAPCSGEWMQYKSEFKFYHWSPKYAKKLAKLQSQLLISAIKCLKVGWELTYSTCTTNIFENEGVISEILALFWSKIELLNVNIDQKSAWIHISSDTSFDTLKVARFRPHIHHTGWFFIAKIKKLSSILTDTSNTFDEKQLQNSKKSPFTVINDLEQIYSLWLWKTAINCLSFLKSTYTVRATTPSSLYFLDKLYIQQIGLPIAKILTNGDIKPIRENLLKLSDNNAI